jgi:hypothetical protein
MRGALGEGPPHKSPSVSVLAHTMSAIPDLIREHVEPLDWRRDISLLESYCYPLDVPSKPHQLGLVRLEILGLDVLGYLLL